MKTVEIEFHKNFKNSIRKYKFSTWNAFLLFPHQIFHFSDPILLCLCKTTGTESFCFKILMYLCYLASPKILSDLAEVKTFGNIVVY